MAEPQSGLAQRNPPVAAQIRLAIAPSPRKQAKRNPGEQRLWRRRPRISLALNPGYRGYAHAREGPAEPMDRSPNAWQCARIPSPIGISAARAGNNRNKPKRRPRNAENQTVSSRYRGQI